MNTVALAEIAEVRLGRQRSPKNHSGPQNRKYLRAANVGWDGLKLDDIKTMNFTDAEMEIYKLRPGDLLLNEASGSPNEVGKPAIWMGEIEDCAFQNTLLRVRPSAEVDSRYLFHYLRQQAVTAAFARGSRGVGIHHLGREALSKWPVPLPRLDEQRRIAAVLDRVNDLRAKQLAAQSALDGLVDSIFLEMFGDPATQNRFESTALGDLVDFYSGGTPSKSKPEYWDGQLPWFSPKDLKKPYLWDSVDHISDAVPNETAIRKLPADTVVLVVRGMILAHTVPVSLIRVPATVNQDLKALLPRNPVSPLFLQTALRVQHQRILGLVSTAAHGTKKLETQSLREVRIPRPGHLAEDQFGRRVRQSGFLSDELTQVTGELDSLFNSIQSRAFSGRL